jgi:hypothetical protein
MHPGKVIPFPSINSAKENMNMKIGNLVRSLTSTALEQVAPDEVFLLDHYDASGQAFGSASKGPQGFGAETAIALALPFLLKFFEKFIEKIGSNAADTTYKAISGYLATSEPTPDTVVTAALEAELVAAGFTETRATEIVVAVVASIDKHRDRLQKQ